MVVATLVLVSTAGSSTHHGGMPESAVPRLSLARSQKHLVSLLRDALLRCCRCDQLTLARISSGTDYNPWLARSVSFVSHVHSAVSSGWFARTGFSYHIVHSSYQFGIAASGRGQHYSHAGFCGRDHVTTNR